MQALILTLAANITPIMENRVQNQMEHGIDAKTKSRMKWTLGLCVGICEWKRKITLDWFTTETKSGLVLIDGFGV